MNTFETQIASFKILSNNRIQKKYKTKYQHLFQDKIFKQFLNIKSDMTIHLYEIDIKEQTLIYEYFPSVNLRERLKSSKKISFTELIQVFKQMAQAIDFLHSKNIAHIDIDDTNFLINEKLEIKLNDYDFIEILNKENQALKQIDILAYALLVYRVIQLSYQWNAIKDFKFEYCINNLNYLSCAKFFDSLDIKQNIIYNKGLSDND